VASSCRDHREASSVIRARLDGPTFIRRSDVRLSLNTLYGASNRTRAMLDLDSITQELLEAVLQTLEKHPELARRLRALLGIDRLLEPDHARLLTVREYAEHAGYCPRHVENLIRDGMPLLGQGRARRVCVHEADEWLRERRGKHPPDAPTQRLTDIAERARQDALRAHDREQRRALEKTRGRER